MISELGFDRNKWVKNNYSHFHQILPEGYRSGKLTIVRFLGSNKHKKHIYECRCDCGNFSKVCGSPLKLKTICRCNKCSTNIYAAIKAHYDKRFYSKLGRVHETILTLSDEFTASEIADYVGYSIRQTRGIQCLYGIPAYGIVGRGRRTRHRFLPWKKNR